MFSARLLTALAVLVLLGGHLGMAQPTSPALAPAPALGTVKSWGYQLQNVDPDVLAASPYDLLVIDYSRDGSDALALAPQDLARLKVKPDGWRRPGAARRMPSGAATTACAIGRMIGRRSSSAARTAISTASSKPVSTAS